MPLTYICRLATVASGAASGKLLEYEVGGPRVSVQTAYGIEVEVGTFRRPKILKLLFLMNLLDFNINFIILRYQLWCIFTFSGGKQSI